MKWVYGLLRVIALVVLAVVAAPFLIALAIILLFFGPKVDWPDYWANLFASGTKAIWHWTFGAPRVRIARTDGKLSSAARRFWP